MDVSALKLDNYFQVSHKHLDYRSNGNTFHVSLIQDILFGVEPNSYSGQQIDLEDAACQIKDSRITIPVSHKKNISPQFRLHCIYVCLPVATLALDSNSLK